MSNQRKYLMSDLYKITMQQVVWQKFSNCWVKYHYKLRSKGIDLIPFRKTIEEKFEQLSGLGCDKEEINFLSQLGYFKPAFCTALSHFKMNTDFVHIKEIDGMLDIVIEAPWMDGIPFEVHMLQLISEAYFEEYARHHPEVWTQGRKRLNSKIENLLRIYEEADSIISSGRQCSMFRLSEFGTRRSFTSEWQEEVVATFADKLPKAMFSGTSNVWLAKKYGLKPQGTMAHEYICAHAALYPLNIAQKKALYNWNDVYEGKLGIALSDTFTFDQFLRDFDLGLASLFDGARHDSGDPFRWGIKLMRHYKDLGINSFSKQAVWSDNLDLRLAYELWTEFRWNMKTVFGIGTHLTNDMGVYPISQVIKMTHLNGMPLIKISDEPAKVMCEDEAYKAWAMHYFMEMAPNMPEPQMIS